MTEDAPDVVRMSPSAGSWEGRSPRDRPAQGQDATGTAPGEQQGQTQPQLGQQQGYGWQGPSDGPPQYGAPAQQAPRSTASARTAGSRIWGGFLWYLLAASMVLTVGLLSQAVIATTSGHDPVLGAHPVMTSATVEDYDVVTCNRSGSCQYDENVTFGTAAGTQKVTIKGVDTRPIIGSTQAIWYPAGNPAAAQTDGPHSAIYYWLGTAFSGVAASLLLLVVVRRHRRFRR